MTKTEFISRIAVSLREKGVRKAIRSPKHVFHISDDDGNRKDFIVKETNKSALFNTKDISEIIDAALEVIKTSLQNGEKISIHGIGTLGLRYMHFGNKNVLGDDEEVTEVPPRYVPKFTSGRELKRAAMIYTQITEEKKMSPIVDDDVDDEEEADVTNGD